MNVNRITIQTKKYDELKICFFSDQHLGSKNCDLEKVKSQIQYIKDTPNAICILLGDTVDCGLKNSVGAGTFDNIMTPAEQIELAVELLTPIKHKIYGIHNGNHSNRVTNETSLLPEKMIANELGVPYLGDTCFHYLRFNDQTYILFTAHGSTGSTTISGALSACMKYADFADADLYCMGHAHVLAEYSKITMGVNLRDKTLEERKRHFVLTGGYLKWKGSYAEQKAYSPLKIGSAAAVFSGSRHDIHVRI